tara:strand:- start:79729 stop:80235 length:507 start_codon:yes stop_codon:yes gene_type:complete
MCFDPKVDGALIWPSIHIFAANADTPEKMKAFISFIEGLQVLYPCQKCRVHYTTFLKKYPIENYAGSAQTALYWTWLLHDKVNIHLNKPDENRLAWDVVREFYMSNCSGSDLENDLNSPTCMECQVEVDTIPPPQNKMSTYRMKSIPRTNVTPSSNNTHRRYISANGE